MNSIPLYKEINEGHRSTGSALRTKNPSFHCFKMSDANDMKVDGLPPHRADFFILAISFGNSKFSFTVNNNPLVDPECFIVCIAPGQVSSFVKQEDWFGYCTFFKSDFIRYRSELNFLEDYPFFSIHESKLFPVDDDQIKSLSINYQQIISEQDKEALYGEEIMRNSFLALLWQVRRIYDNAKTDKAIETSSRIIASKFQFLVNKNFLNKTLVEDYAQMLNITPNHLSQTIREVTGNKAKNIISKRRLEEAKYLLQYTQNDIAEISYHLNFSEPTHFAKFFKKEVRYTPLQYRRIYK